MTDLIISEIVYMNMFNIKEDIIQWKQLFYGGVGNISRSTSFFFNGMEFFILLSNTAFFKTSSLIHYIRIQG